MSDKSTQFRVPSRFMRGNTSLLTIAISAASLFTCLRAQQSLPDTQLSNSPQTATKPFTLLQITREVDLDIVVTDATGQPVSGLTKDDFQIFEDHNPQHASSFEEHPIAITAPTTAQKLPQNTFTNYVSGSSGNASIVILLDSLDTPLKYQMYAYQQATDFIKHLPPGVDVALFTLNARMQLLQGFTSDTKLLLEAMRSKRAQPKPSYLIDSAPGAAIVREGSNDVYRKQLLLSGMATLGRYLAGFPGRKSLIWLTVDIPGHRNNTVSGPSQTLTGADASNTPTVTVPDFGDVSSTTVVVRPGAGIQNSPGASPTSQSGAAGASGQSANSVGHDGQSSPATGADGPHTDGSELGITSIDDTFDSASGALALGRVAIYILDPRGLMSPSELAINPDWRFQFAGMDDVAKATGGHAFYNSNRLDLVMDQVAAEGSNYYRLTYSPANKDWNGAFRHLQVRIAGSTKNSLTSAVTGKPAVGPLHLGYRPGYYASDSGTALGTSIASAADSAGPAVFTLAAENKEGNPDASNGPTHAASPRRSLQASMTMGELPSTEILFAASVKPSDSIVQLAKNSPLPPGDFMRAKFRNQPYRLLNIVFATNLHSLVLPVATDGLHHGKVEFVSVIYNAQGDVVNSLITGLSLNLREASYQKMLITGIGAHQTIAVPLKGEYIVRLGVHDATSDRIGAVEIPFNSINTEEEISSPAQSKP